MSQLKKVVLYSSETLSDETHLRLVFEGSLGYQFNLEFSSGLWGDLIPFQMTFSATIR